MKTFKKGTFFFAAHLLAFLFVTTSLPAQSTPLEASQAAQTLSKEQALEREATFKHVEELLSVELETLRLKKEHLTSQTEHLQKQFSQNESSLAKLEETMRLETSSLGDVFDVVRQLSFDLNKDRLNTPASLEIILLNQGEKEQAKFDFTREEIAREKYLPSLDTLFVFWEGLKEALQSSAQLSQLTLNVRDNNGLLETQEVTRLGHLALINQEGYLLWDTQNNQANQTQIQPENGLTLQKISTMKPGDVLLLDPSKGAVFEQLAQKPTLFDRYEQAGWVGKIITLLLALGLTISFVQGAVLLNTRMKINAQQTCLQTPGNNPLGRLLRVYKTHANISTNHSQTHALENLELRMMEVIIDEHKNFEKGLSMLKLLGALAPMLGLLGTVIGMIETFQVIVQYGNGDPRIMAAGISMALVTTVLGLIAAMPLLLAHNLLSTQASLLNGLLEKIGVGLVAQEYEREYLPLAGKKP